MRYLYQLNENDLINMKIQGNEANNYYIEQNGWTCNFDNLYSVKIENGIEFKDEIIIKGSELTENQKDYITKLDYIPC